MLIFEDIILGAHTILLLILSLKMALQTMSGDACYRSPHAGTRANYFACVIYHTRLLEILINLTFHRVGYIVGIPKTEFEYYRQSLVITENTIPS